MTGWQLDVGASESTIPDSAASTGRSLPDDHVRFLRDSNVQNPCSPLQGAAQAIIVHTDGSHLWLVFDLRR
jgi:hypothetical protein